MCIFARAKIDAGGGGGLKFCGYIGKEWRERRTGVAPLGGRRAVKKNFSFEDEDDIDERHPIALSVAYKVIVVVLDIPITSSSSSWTTTRRT